MVELLFQGLGSFTALLLEGCDVVVQYDAVLFCSKRQGGWCRESWDLLLRRGYCFLGNRGIS